MANHLKSMLIASSRSKVVRTTMERWRLQDVHLNEAICSVLEDLCRESIPVNSEILSRAIRQKLLAALFKLIPVYPKNDPLNLETICACLTSTTQSRNDLRWLAKFLNCEESEVLVEITHDAYIKLFAEDRIPVVVSRDVQFICQVLNTTKRRLERRSKGLMQVHENCDGEENGTGPLSIAKSRLPNPLETALKRERYELVMRAFKELSVLQKRVVLARIVYNLSFAKIAIKIELTVKRAKQIYQLAIRRLRKADVLSSLNHEQLD